MRKDGRRVGCLLMELRPLPPELTFDMWFQMDHHDWKDLVDEHNALLAELKRLRGDD